MVFDNKTLIGIFADSMNVPKPTPTPTLTPTFTPTPTITQTVTRTQTPTPTPTINRVIYKKLIVNWSNLTVPISTYVPFYNVNDRPRINTFRTDGDCEFLVYMNAGSTWEDPISHIQTPALWGNRSSGFEEVVIPLTIGKNEGIDLWIDKWQIPSLNPVFSPSSGWTITDEGFQVKFQTVFPYNYTDSTHDIYIDFQNQNTPYQICVYNFPFIAQFHGSYNYTIYQHDFNINYYAYENVFNPSYKIRKLTSSEGGYWVAYRYISPVNITFYYKNTSTSSTIPLNGWTNYAGIDYSPAPLIYSKSFFTPTPTPTLSNAPTRTPTPTSSSTPTPTPTPTQTRTPTQTPTQTPTNTQTPTQTPTNTHTPTSTPVNTSTPTRTSTPTQTQTRTQTPTQTRTPTQTPTQTQTQTRTPTPTLTRLALTAPEIISVTTQVQSPTQVSATVFFLGSNPSTTVVNYQYTFNNGATWTSISPAKNNSPITILNLSYATSYNLRIRSTDGVIFSPESNIFTFITPLLPTPTPTQTQTQTPTITQTITPTYTPSNPNPLQNIIATSIAFSNTIFNYNISQIVTNTPTVNLLDFSNRNSEIATFAGIATYLDPYFWNQSSPYRFVTITTNTGKSYTFGYSYLDNDWIMRRDNSNNTWTAVAYMYAGGKEGENESFRFSNLNNMQWGTAPINSCDWTLLLQNNSFYNNIANILLFPNGTNSNNSMTTWSAGPIIDNDEGSMSAWAYGNGTYVALSFFPSSIYPRVVTSTDGINWTPRTSFAGDTESWWGYLAHGNGKFVAIDSLNGRGHRMMYSTDGINWIQNDITSLQNLLTIRFLIFANNMFVAAGIINSAQNAKIITSTDGINWTVRGNSVLSFNHVIYDMIYANNMFVAVAASNVGSVNNIITSSDGINWVTRNVEVGNWLCITYGNGKFVVLPTNDNRNKVATSTDGINWTVNTTNTNPSYGYANAAYGNGMFVTISNSGNQPSIMTSFDGINWNLRNVNINVFGRYIRYINNKFMVVSNRSYFYDY